MTWLSDLRFQLMFCVAAGMLPFSSLASVYKCAQDGGQVVYQDLPCPAGRELRDFDKDPATVSVVPFGQPPGASGTKGGGRSAAKNDANSRRDAPAGDTSKSESARKKSTHDGDAAQRKFLVPGIDEGEVMARIGRPDMTSKAGKGATRWTYMPVPEDANTLTTLTFEHGRLVEVQRKVVR